MNDIKGDWCYWIWINLFQGIRSQEIPGNIRLQFPLKMWSVNYATSSVSSWNFSECENFFSKLVREAPLLCNFIRADLSDASHSLLQNCHDLTLAWEWDVCPKSNFQNSVVIFIDAMKEDHACSHSLFPNLQIANCPIICSGCTTQAFRKCCHPLKPNPLAKQIKSSIQHFPNQLIP